MKEGFGRFLTDPGKELGRWARFARFQIELWRFCALRLRENNVMAMSAALSFRTIFAMIPIMVLAFLSLKSIGALEDSKQSMRNFLDASGFSQIATVTEETDATTQPAGQATSAPTTEPTEVFNVADEIEALVTQVESKLTFERIGPVGGVMLIWTALTLLTTMERSLNRIFGAPKSRAVGPRVLLYWSTMTLGPVALVAAGYMGQQIVDRFRDAPGWSWLLVTVGWIGPLLVGVIVLSMVYKLLPNTKVGYEAAVGGAAVAVPCWGVAKWAFSAYVSHWVVTGNLYGVLGLLPLFLLWLNLSWLIFLFGAELAHTAANLSSMKRAELAEDVVLGPSDLLAVSVSFAESYVTGEGPVSIGKVVDQLKLPGDSAERLIHQLIQHGVLCEAGHDEQETQYILAQPADRIPVTWIMNLGDPRARHDLPVDEHDSIAEAVDKVRDRTQASLADLTLADLLNGQTSTPNID
jgi:YihY family inner membrane protein